MHARHKNGTGTLYNTIDDIAFITIDKTVD